MDYGIIPIAVPKIVQIAPMLPATISMTGEVQDAINAAVITAVSSVLDEIKSMVVYNVTVKHPLESGYYTAATARAVVPDSVRSRGMVITYETANAKWVTEQFVRASLGSWTSDTGWISLLRSNLNSLLKMTAAEYAALDPKDEDTLYITIEEEV